MQQLLRMFAVIALLKLPCSAYCIYTPMSCSPSRMHTCEHIYTAFPNPRTFHTSMRASSSIAAKLTEARNAGPLLLLLLQVVTALILSPCCPCTWWPDAGREVLV